MQCAPEAATDSWVAAFLADDARRLPRRPYCTDDLERGLNVRPLATALTKANIQVNPPTVRLWSCFDIDRRGAAHAWEDADLPPPTWAATNPDNGRAHLAWGLSIPVRVQCEDGNDKPLRYLAAIEGCMAARLGADASYHGVTTKNPLHPRWIVHHTGRLLTYDLHELAEWLPELPQYRLPRRAPDQAGVGRNVYLFQRLRAWACRAIRPYWAVGPRGWDEWRAHCESRACTVNAEFTTPLHWSEVRHIAKSVARWTWKNTTAAGFSEWQAARGRKATNQAQAGKASGGARRKASEGKRAAARQMAQEGRSTREIAAALEVNQSTAARWLKGDA